MRLRADEGVVRRSIRCRLGWHRWVTTYSEDGTTHFLRCARCPKEADFAPRQFWMGE